MAFLQPSQTIPARAHPFTHGHTEARRGPHTFHPAEVWELRQHSAKQGTGWVEGFSSHS